MAAERAHDTDHHDHLVPIPIYIGVFLALMVGTALTVWVARHDFGMWNTPVAMAIAVTKATLVVLFFMHVKYSSRLIQILVAAAFLWLGIMLTGTLADYYSPHVGREAPTPSVTRE